MNQKVNIVQVGVGNWGKNLLRNFYSHPKVNLKAVCDINDDTLAKVKKDFPSMQVIKSAETLFQDPEIDAAIIATQADTHYQYAKAFLENGKHVFVEKPMVLDLAHGEEIVALAEKKKKILMVGHILEYHPAFVKVKDIIDQGELGEVYYVYTSRVNLGVVRRNENSLWSFAPHDISIILMFINSKPLEVSCTGKAYLQPGIEDVVFATIHFEDKKMAHLHVSWLDPHKVRKVTVVGSKKMAVIDDMESSEKIRIHDKGVDFKGDYTQFGEYQSLRIGDILIPYIKNQEPLKIECNKFIESIQTNTPPISDGQDGLKVVRILNAAQESLDKGGMPVKL